MARPQIVWFRNDLRLQDQPAVRAAARAGPVLPLYILDDESEGLRPMGAASRWWLHLSLESLAASLGALGGGLLLRRGNSAAILGQLADSLDADIHALAQPEPWWPVIEQALGPRLRLHPGTSLVPTGQIRSGSGEPYRVFTPFWRAHARHMPPPAPVPAPQAIAFAEMPASDRLADWNLLPRRPDWAKGFHSWQPGEAGAHAALAQFLPRAADYDRARDFPSAPGTSRLSPHLHFGEISPAAVWHGAAAGEKDAAAFTRQLVWRDFAHDLLTRYPLSASQPHRPAFANMPWTDHMKGEGAAQLAAWQQGRTGYPLVDAGMRQLWHTGWMHNRVRMVTASFLAKHLLIDWREGERWYWDTLVDADLANNAMGWQWVMGSGVDSAPYYRIFAPIGQSVRFDAAAYIRRFVPELARLDDSAIHGPFEQGHGEYPPPIVDHAAARARALAAYAAIRA